MTSDGVINETTEAEAAKPNPQRIDHEPKKASKPRAKLACRHCRRRKVRCDVYPHGPPCTNCRLDKIECTLCAKKRRINRRPSREATPLINETVGLQLRDDLGVPTGTSCEANPTGENTSFHEYQFSESQYLSKGNDADSLNASSASDTPHDKDQDAPTTPRQLPLADLPSFIHFNLSHVSNEAVFQLQRKGCFILPQKDALDDLLKCYFDYVHPRLPFLDEQEFWEAYLDGDPERSSFHKNDGKKISLVLFQAVLFAATTCAPISVLRRAGYSSRKTARRDTFHKVLALYSSDVEQDKMNLLQTLLLMSFWRDNPAEDKDAWHWSGRAISMSSALGLHRRPATWLTEREKTLRKRCWWSCVVRDRMLALSEQRAPRVQLDEHDVPMLTLADYNVGLRSFMSDLSPEEELGKRTALSMFSLQFIRLALCVGTKGPSLARSLKSSPTTVEVWARARLTIRDDESVTDLVDIDFWRLNLPEILQYPPIKAGDETVQPWILVHRNSLHIYYHKLILSICIPRLLHSTSQQDSQHNSQLIRRSSTTLSKLYDELVDCESIHCLPSGCFGPSTSLEQIGLHIATSFKATQDDGFPRAGAHMATTNTPGTFYPTSNHAEISTPPVSDCSGKSSTQRTHDIGSVEAMNIDGWHETQVLAEREVLNRDHFDYALDLVPDAPWTLDEVQSYGVDDPRYSGLAEDSLDGIMSDTHAPTPSMLLHLEALLSP